MTPNPIVDTPLEGIRIVNQDGTAVGQFQILLESLEKIINGSQLPEYTVATVPDATENLAMLIYVSDETGGAVPAFSDGTNFRRVTDRAIIS